MTLVRFETALDHDAVRRIHTLAFDGPVEARLVDQLRGAPGSLSLVAEEGAAVVGHILFTAVRIDGAAAERRVAGLGPMAVSPASQRSGIGSRLVREGLETCRREGCDAVVLVGHADYYPRFGFRPGSGWDLRCEFEVPDEVFMAMELTPGALSGGGLVRFAPEFSEG